MQNADTIDRETSAKAGGIDSRGLRALLAAATPGPWTEGIDGNLRIYGPDCSGEHSGLLAIVYKGRPNVSLIVALHNAAPALLDAAEERDALRAEIADLKTWLIAFGAPSAARIASACGLPDGHLLPHHYDTLARCGARMDSFTRAALAKETPNA